MKKLTFKPVTAATRNDFIEVIDVPGWQKQCWCMVWAQGCRPDGGGCALQA